MDFVIVSVILCFTSVFESMDVFNFHVPGRLLNNLNMHCSETAIWSVFTAGLISHLVTHSTRDWCMSHISSLLETGGLRCLHVYWSSLGCLLRQLSTRFCFLIIFRKFELFDFLLLPHVFFVYLYIIHSVKIATYYCFSLGVFFYPLLCCNKERISFFLDVGCKYIYKWKITIIVLDIT